ncbi:MAG: hypothetical protein ISS77_01530 [Phycisphaerae bacterium]|nr:hypothetical protein [Phycisphaerae bacterium]
MGLDFTVLRILILAGILRMTLAPEPVKTRFNKFDKILVAWVLCGSAIYILQHAEFSAVINRSGYLFDALGMYWLFRLHIKSWDDIHMAVKIFAACAIFLALLVAVERLRGENPFTYLGRVITAERLGKYRCQAAFPHAIMLGLFWATLVPLFAAFVRFEKSKLLYFAGIISSIFMIFCTASSTPVLVLIGLALFLAVYKYRIYGKLIFLCSCFVALGLHIVMNHSVWHLITYVNIVGGSTGWHRYYLIEQAANHFSEWAVFGTQQTSHWGMGLADITNQYVLEGVRGGFITLIIFAYLLFTAVKSVGGYSLRPLKTKYKWFGWCLCVSLLGHCMSFVGVAYFGQIMFLLYLTFAMVGFVYTSSHKIAAFQKNGFADYQLAFT